MKSTDLWSMLGTCYKRAGIELRKWEELPPEHIAVWHQFTASIESLLCRYIADLKPRPLQPGASLGDAADREVLTCRIIEETKRADRAEARFSSANGKLGALQRKINSLELQIKQERAARIRRAAAPCTRIGAPCKHIHFLTPDEVFRKAADADDPAGMLTEGMEQREQVASIINSEPEGIEPWARRRYTRKPKS